MISSKLVGASMGALFIALVFLGGYWVGSNVEQGRIASENLTVVHSLIGELSNDMKELKEKNAAIQADSAAVLEENENARKEIQSATDDIRAFFDGLRSEANTNSKATGSQTGSSCATSERETSRLRSELQRTLGLYNETVAKYRSEASRADEVTRELNLCIRTLNAQ